MTDEIVSVDYEGYRFRAPFLCMCCGVETSAQQWAFGRTCGKCDMGACERHNRGYRKGAEHERPSWWRDYGHSREQKMQAYVEAVGANRVKP